MGKQAQDIKVLAKNKGYDLDSAQPILAQWDNCYELKEGADWIQSLRSNAKKQIDKMGLPTTRLERWKYTSLASAIRSTALQYSPTDVSYNDPVSVVQNLKTLYKKQPDWFSSLLAAHPPGGKTYGDMSLWYMCNAFCRDGLLVDIPAGKICEKPVEITITGHNNNLYVPRSLIRLGPGAELTLIEYHKGQGTYWNNRLTQIVIGDNAKLTHIRIQDNSHSSIYTQNTHIELNKDSIYKALNLCMGSLLSRNQIHAELKGQNANCNLYGLNLLRGQQLGDTTITIEHKAPHCRSHQFYRTVLDGQAHGVFQGKVHVHKEAQKTDGYQLSNTLLLSEGAKMDTKPELEIYADDVKCSHGATCGQIEDEALFYLRSRGLPIDLAKSILIKAFVNEVVEKFEDKNVSTLADRHIELWLNK